MSTLARDALIELLLSSYVDLERRLARRLGSDEVAGDALQDTYVRLRRTENLGEIRNPRAYLFRMAINIARNRLRADVRLLSATQIELLTDLPDESPDPSQIAQARSDLAAVEHALDQLPSRRRAIFRRAWVDGASHAEISVEFGIAIRTVGRELQLATESLHRATQRNGSDLPFSRSGVSLR